MLVGYRWIACEYQVNWEWNQLMTPAGNVSEAEQSMDAVQLPGRASPAGLHA
jgi:hypothetical protein